MGTIEFGLLQMIIKGLEEYGFAELATNSAEKYLKGIAKVYKRTGTFWENYAPKYYKPGDPSRPNFVGWTACGPIQLLIENVIGIRPDSQNNTINLYINKKSRHGIKDLKVGELSASLICNKRDSVNATPDLKVQNNKAFTLIISYNG